LNTRDLLRRKCFEALHIIVPSELQHGTIVAPYFGLTLLSKVLIELAIYQYINPSKTITKSHIGSNIILQKVYVHTIIVEFIYEVQPKTQT
jgi:hypothetical protein